MATKQPSRDWLRFQQNLKSTSFGVRFGKKLFLNPNSLSGRDITNAMKLLGLDVPKEVSIGVDLAQIFASSSTLVSSYENYNTLKDAESLQAFTASSANTLKIFTSIADKNGWIDQDTASAANVGTTTLRLLATGGADVTAWIALAMEFGVSSESAKAKAQGIAQRNAFDWYKGQISSQAKALAESQQKLQKGEIGIFSFLSEAADKGNLLFENSIKNNETLQRVFPGLKFIPVFNGYVYAEGSSTTWYGDTKTANYKLDYRTIGEMDENQAREYIWKYVIKPYTFNYLEVNEYYKTRNKGSLMGAAILACVSGLTRFDDSGKIAFEFYKQMLTPKDVGDEFIFNEYVKEPRSLGLSWLTQSKTSYSKEEINHLEDHGLIVEMFKDSQVRDTLKEAYSFGAFPITETIAKIDWREIQNFIACLDYVSLVKFDPSMKGKQGVISELQDYDFLPSLADFETKMNEAYTKSMIRKMNTNAKANVAYFLGTTPEKVKQISKIETDKPAIFTIKG